MHGLWGEDEQKSPDFQALRASVLGGMLRRSNELIDSMPPADCPGVACKLWGLWCVGQIKVLKFFHLTPCSQICASTG